ncbi:transposase [Absiella sp. AM29-15]|nr:transposase [Absiella sp. AM29-15]
MANGKFKSILREDPQRLLDDYAGTGTKIGTNKERVDFGKVIGQYYDEQTGKYLDTTKGIIHYNSKGQAHIVPARP